MSICQSHGIRSLCKPGQPRSHHVARLFFLSQPKTETLEQHRATLLPIAWFPFAKMQPQCRTTQPGYVICGLGELAQLAQLAQLLAWLCLALPGCQIGRQ